MHLCAHLQYQIETIKQGELTYINLFVNEASSTVVGTQVRVLLCTGDSHIPHLSPCSVQCLVNWVDTRVMGSHRVMISECWDTVIL